MVQKTSIAQRNKRQQRQDSQAGSSVKKKQKSKGTAQNTGADVSDDHPTPQGPWSCRNAVHKQVGVVSLASCYQLLLQAFVNTNTVVRRDQWTVRRRLPS